MTISISKHHVCSSNHLEQYKRGTHTTRHNTIYTNSYRIGPGRSLQNRRQEPGGEREARHPEDGRGMGGLGPFRKLLHSQH